MHCLISLNEGCPTLKFIFQAERNVTAAITTGALTGGADIFHASRFSHCNERTPSA